MDRPEPVAATGRQPILEHTFFSLVARGSMLTARGLGLILISRMLGTEQFGVYALLLVTYNIFASFGAFGIEPTNVYLAGRRPQRVPVLVGNTLLLAAVLGSIAGVLFDASVFLLRARIFTDSPWSAVVLTTFAVPVAIAHNGLVGVVVGLGRFRYYGLVEAGKALTYLTVLGAFQWHGHLTVTTALGTYCAILLMAAAVHLLVLSRFGQRPPRARPRVLWKTLAMSRAMLLVQLSGVFGLRLDVYAVRLFGSISLVGSYALASHLSELLLHVGRSFTLVVFSGTARGNRPSALRVGTLMRSLMAAALVLSFVAVVAREELLLFLFGETSRGSGPVLILRMPGILAAAVTLLLGGELLGRGRSDIVVRANLILAGVFALLVWPFASWNTSLGSAIAFTLAALTQVAWITWSRRSERATRIQRPTSDQALGLPFLSRE
jgi:O-antigen/teichoic acid export membrane protein